MKERKKESNWQFIISTSQLATYVNEILHQQKTFSYKLDMIFSLTSHVPLSQCTVHLYLIIKIQIMTGLHFYVLVAPVIYIEVVS